MPATPQNSPTLLQPASSLTLICSDDGDPIALRKANAAALEVKRPFSFALMAAHVVRVGPLVVPGRSACYQCLAGAGMTRQRKASRHGSYRAVAARIVEFPLLVDLAAVTACPPCDPVIP